MAYTRVHGNWLNNDTSTPVDEAAMDHIEAGVQDAAATADQGLAQAGSALTGLDLKADKLRAILPGTGLVGGGDLTADRTLSVSFGTTAGTVAAGNDPRFTGSGGAAPLAHAGTHSATGSDPVTLSQSQISGLTAIVWDDKIRLTDQAVTNSTTVATDDTLSFSLAASTTYLIDALLLYDVAASADLKLQVNVPSGTFRGLSPVLPAATVPDVAAYAVRTENTNWTAAGAGAGVAYLTAFPFAGVITTSAACTLSLRYAQNVAATSDLTVRTGSRLSIRRAN